MAVAPLETNLDSVAKKRRDQIVSFVRSRMQMIDVIPHQGMFNYRCFDNAAEYHRLHGGAIAEVMIVDSGEPILHYVNVDKDGKYLETTLGYKAVKFEYYLIRMVHPNDIVNIEREFERSLQSWLLEYTSWFDRNLFGVRRLV